VKAARAAAWAVKAAGAAAEAVGAAEHAKQVDMLRRILVEGGAE